MNRLVYAGNDILQRYSSEKIVLDAVSGIGAFRWSKLPYGVKVRIWHIGRHLMYDSPCEVKIEVIEAFVYYAGPIDSFDSM